MIINQDYTNHERHEHIEKGTHCDVVDFIANHDGKEWVKVVFVDGKTTIVPAYIISPEPESHNN